MDSARDAAPLLPFPPGCRVVRLVRREKRFLALVQDGSSQYWAHTNNSGSMLGLVRPGVRAIVSPASNPKRKLAWTLEAVESDGSWLSVNTLAPNRALRAAWERGLLPEAAGTDSFRPEAKVGESRIDALLSGPEGDIWVECKNVTLLEDGGVAYFPDAASERGRKHLAELARLARAGVRVATFYFIPMRAARCFAPADFIDPAYADAFYAALADGMEAWPYRAHVAEDGVRLGERLPVRMLLP